MMERNVPQNIEIEVHLLYKVYKNHAFLSKFTKILFCLSFFAFMRYTKIG